MSALKWLMIVAGCYGGLLALMYGFQRNLMYFPDRTRTPPAAAGLPQAQDIMLTAGDGTRLVAWFVAPRDDRPVVLYFQGNAGGSSLRVGRFRWLTADGTGLLALSYRGYGGSDGSPSEDGLIRDALAAYDFLRTRFSADRIVVFGESLGTAVAIALAEGREIKALILDAPFTSAADIGAAAYPFAPVRWLMKDKWLSHARVAGVSAPMLVLHGERDSVIPVAYGERLFALAKEPKRMVRFARGGHVNLDDYGAAETVKSFLAEIATVRKSNSASP
jgi:fermentation-respiration switch protein FrsA (DUF1100 family)